MPAIETTAVRIPIGVTWLDGDFHAPDGTEAIVAFGCTNGASRLDPHHRRIVEVLAEACIGALVFDLLTPAEDDDDRFGRHRLDVDLLTRRFVAGTHWLLDQPRTRDLPLGYFGRGAGAAAALRAAADHPDIVGAVVCEEGRPDLAGEALARLRAPVLFVVAGEDAAAVQSHEKAEALVGATKRLRIVPGAARLLEEPGALEQGAHLARNWFVEHLVRRPECVVP